MTPKNLVAVYEQTRQALSLCEDMTACRDMADKMAGLSAYAKQARDKDLEYAARRVSHRAKIRIGEILLERKKGTKWSKDNSRRALAREAGIDDRLIGDYICAARVDPLIRERMLESPVPVTWQSLRSAGRTRITKREKQAADAARKPATRTRNHGGGKPSVTDAYRAIWQSGQFDRLGAWFANCTVLPDLVGMLTPHDVEMLHRNLTALNEQIDDLLMRVEARMELPKRRG